MNLSTYALSVLTATLGVATTSAVDVPCLTESDCRAAADEAGITNFYADVPNDTKGCYIKEGKNKAFYTPGGSVSQMMTEDLPGIQARLWCEGPESIGKDSRDAYDGGYSSDMLSNEEWLQGELKVDKDWDYDQNDPVAEDMNSGSAIPFRIGVITAAVVCIVSSL